MRTKKQNKDVAPVSVGSAGLQSITSDVVKEPKDSTIKIDSSETAELVELDREMANLKQIIADLQLKTMLLETDKTKTAQKYFEANNAFHVKVKDIAEKYGIDMNNPEKSKWNLDIASGVFTKVS